MTHQIRWLKLEWACPKAYYVRPFREFYVWSFGRRVCETPDGPAVFWSIGPFRISLYSFGYWKRREAFFSERHPTP